MNNEPIRTVEFWNSSLIAVLDEAADFLRQMQSVMLAVEDTVTFKAGDSWMVRLYYRRKESV